LEHSISEIDHLVENAVDYAGHFDHPPLPIRPRKGVVVLACMDARLRIYGLLGLEEGDAHIIRNAGGVASEDAIRSIIVSQRLLGTKEIIIIHHTDCGMETFSDEAMADAIERDTGIRPEFSFEAFPSAKDDVATTKARLIASPFIPHRDQIRGFLFDVATGELHEVGD
jgi:carbonic anhydrase